MVSDIKFEESNIRRLVYWDIVKGVAILLVIIGHQIQYSCGSYDFIDNPIFKSIYGFHMALFMIVSGYFFCFTIKKHTVKKIFVNRSRQCIIPICTFTVLSEIMLGHFSPYAWIRQSVVSLWFLWAVFFLSLIVLFVNQLPHKFRGYTYLFLYISFFFFPDWLLSKYIFAMYPCFLIGFLFNEYKVFDRLFSKHLIMITILSFILYVVLMLFFSKETYIYWSKYSVISGGGYSVLVDVQRTITGFCGSFFLLGLLYITYKKSPILITNILTYLGRNTLQLYVISMLPFFISIEERFSNGEVSYWLAVVSTLFVTGVSVLLVELLKRSQLGSFLFFGKAITPKSE